MKRKNSKTKFPPGWNDKRVQSVIRHYDNQTDEEAIAEDEARVKASAATTVRVPSHLLAQIRAMIAKDRQRRRSA